MSNQFAIFNNSANFASTYFIKAEVYANFLFPRGYGDWAFLTQNKEAAKESLEIIQATLNSWLKLLLQDKAFRNNFDCSDAEYEQHITMLRETIPLLCQELARIATLIDSTITTEPPHEVNDIGWTINNRSRVCHEYKELHNKGSDALWNAKNISKIIEILLSDKTIPNTDFQRLLPSPES